ncbi:MFS transporter [Geobacillus sp. B4113_201601]|uniref:MFS transporter n=1 Tax=Geobacillus sp. B4113_201601 TaxID=1586290 RepID=UPI000798DB96|nr:hypothetical protein B4113_3335 [Geobacillus sp. B4113_201601]
MTILMRRNLLFFYMYRIFSRLYFHLAVLFLYFYLNNIDILHIELLLAIYGITLMVSSQWSSKLTKYISEKYIIAIGELVKATGLLFFTFELHFYTLVIAQILSGIGYSLTAGTDSSLLRHILLNEDSSKYKKVESSSNSYMFISFLLAGIVGSILFKFDQLYVFYGSICANFISFLAILSIGTDKSERKQVQETIVGNNTQMENTSLENFWKNYYAISRAFPLAIFIGFLPYFLFRVIEVNLYYFGVVLSLFTLLGFSSARLLVRLNNTFSYKNLTLATTVFSIIAMILLGVSNNFVLSVIAVALLGFSSGGVRPLTLSNLNTNKMDARQRTALFSSMEKLYGFWNAFLLILGGVLFDILGFQKLMIFFTLFYIVLLLFFYRKYSFSTRQPVKDKDFNLKI